MTTRMLVDARHREETRVAVVTGNKIEEFDFESAEHKQLKGNIYLAKVTRVEPSLQAAFVDYGGNRHGFLAFAEIHPDYYQIPKEDKDRLLAEEAEAAAEEAALREQEEAEGDDPAEPIGADDDGDDDGAEVIEVEDDDSVDTIDVTEGQEPELGEDDAEEADDEEADTDDENDGDSSDETSENDKGKSNDGRRNRRGRGRGGKGNNRGKGRGGKTKASDEARAKRMNIRRRYKIQDVIHRRQVLLVQVVKEERGNKGAALTSYLSLAGRYCVLMPNTSHGGGISRKINSAADRKRLKSIISALTLPATMGCIIRTAGLARTKPEIKRDFDYLARLWDEIREKTLSAAAPQLIHTDSDLIKRAIRDIYNRDIKEVMVEGEDGYRAAKDFMKLLMPSHAKRVQQYADAVPLFQRYGVEDQLNAMYHPIVQLKSGGYIVINPTEALVSIDINSGRSTKEHGIEQTALSTNLEAAREIARQLRLRDMAGLVVIDFIDMERHGNSRKVERAMKEALKNDRARIQVGRISSFGLMEMSRQRLRTGVLEASTRECPHCEGTGLVRTESSSALSALRLIEDEAARGNGSQIELQASQEATIYVLNHKRAELAEIEERYHVNVSIAPNGEDEGAKMKVSCSGPKPDRPNLPAPIVDMDDDDGADEAENNAADGQDSENAEGGRKRKRRRGRRGGRNRGKNSGSDGAETSSAEAGTDARNASPETETQTESDGEDKPKSRRGRRGGRDRAKADEANVDDSNAPKDSDVSQESEKPAEEEAPKKPKRRSRAKTKSEKTAEAEAAVDTEAATSAAPDEDAKSDEKPAKPKRRSRAKAKPAADKAEEASTEATPEKKPRAPRKKAAAKTKATGDGETVSKDEKPAPKKRASRAKQTVASEPVVSESAKADVKSPDEGKTADSGDKQKTARSGWWQRTFG